MPGKTLVATDKEARFEGGTAADTVSGTETDSDAVMDRLERLGVSYADVTVMLEKDGVEKFQKSWAELQATVSDELARFATADSTEEAQQ
jgi:transaldolase